MGQHKERPVITYVRMGWGGLSRKNLYSENGTHQPWMGRRECLADARQRGCQANFVERDDFERQVALSEEILAEVIKEENTNA